MIHEINIKSPIDFNNRNANILSNKMQKLISTIHIDKKDINYETRSINAKSTLGILSLCIRQNDEIIFTVHNIDKQKLMSDYEEIHKILSNFNNC